MPQSDYIKQILLKFKTEGDDKVRKTVEGLGKGMNTKDVDKFVKGLSSLNAATKDLYKNFTGIDKVMQGLARNRLGDLNTKLEESVTWAEHYMETIQSTVEGTEANLAANKKLNETLEEQVRLQNEIADAQAKAEAGTIKGLARQLGRGNVAAGAFAMGGAALGAIGTAAGMVNQGITAQMQNRITVAETLKAQALDVFHGDMSQSVLYSNPERRAGIESRIESLQKTKNIQTAGLTLGGVAGGIGLMLGGGALLAAGGITGGASVLPGWAALTGGLGLLGFSGYKNAEHFGLGGKEAYRTQARKLAEQEAASKTMDIEYYKYLQERAPARYEYQRQLGLGDATAVGVRDQFRKAGVTNESQMASMMLGFRGMTSGGAATQLGAQTAQMAQQMGMSTDAAMGLMQSIGRSNRSGVSDAKKDLEEIFTKAVASGVNDSGLIEEYQKSAAALMQRLGNTSAGAAGDFMNKFMMTGADTGRQLQNMPAVTQAYGNIIGGTSPLLQAKKSARLLQLAGKDMNTYSYLSQMSNEQLANISADDPVIGELIKTGKLKPAQLDEFRKGQVTDTIRAAIGQVKGLDMDALKKGGTMSRSLQRLMLAQLVTNAPDLNETQGQQILKGALSDVGDFSKMKFETNKGAVEFGNVAGDKTKILADIAAGRNTAAGKQVQGTAAGESALDQRAYENISKNINQIFEVYKKQSEEAFKNVDSGVLAGPISGISKAADEIQKALQDAASKINNGASSFHNAGSQ